MTDVVARLAASEFLLLTTFRADWSPVPTPVRVVPLDDGLGVWTVDGSAKVRRLRALDRVAVAECDRLGAPLGSELVGGRARLLDPVGTERVAQALRHKYDLSADALAATLHRLGGRPAIGVALDLDQPGASPA